MFRFLLLFIVSTTFILAGTDFSNLFTIGKEGDTATDKVLQFRDGGAFKMNETTNFMQTSHDGTSFFNLYDWTGASVDLITSGNGSFGSITVPTGTFSDLLTLEDAVNLEPIVTPSNPTTGLKVYAKSDDKLYTLTNAGVETEVGSGAGGVANYLENGDLEINDDGYFTFDDGSTFVDGTGGSPTVISFSRNTAAPMAGLGDLQITTSAACTGEGVSTTDFTIPNYLQSKRLTLTMPKTTTGYADGDLQAYIYDKTNAAKIEFDSRDIYAGDQPYIMSFQAAPDSTSYRLSLMCDADSAFTFKADNIVLNYGEPAKGLHVDPIETITYDGYTSKNASNFIKFKTENKNTSSSYISVNNGGDHTKITFLKEVEFSATSNVQTSPASTNSYLILFNSSGSIIKRGIVEVSSQYHNSTLEGRAAVGDYIVVLTNGTGVDSAGFTWVNVTAFPSASPTLMSNDATQRPVDFLAYLSSDQAIAASGEVQVQLNTVAEDNTASWDAANFQWIVPVTGKYNIGAALSASGLVSSSEFVAIRVYKNRGEADSVLLTDSFNYAVNTWARDNKALTVPLVAGDKISFYTQSNSTSHSLSGTNRRVQLSITKSGDPNTISASEAVVAIYGEDTGGNPIGTSPTLIKFSTKIRDTHNAYDPATGLWTAPRSGTVKVCSGFQSDFETLTTSQTYTLQLWDDTPARVRLMYVDVGSGATIRLNYFGCVPEYVTEGQKLGVYASSSVATAINGVADANHLSFIME